MSPCVHGINSDKYPKLNSLLSTGEIGITLNGGWSEPYDPDNQTHWEASERQLQFNFGWFGEPIFGAGDYPQVMKEMIAEKSALQGYNRSRLPEFTQQEIDDLKGMYSCMAVCACMLFSIDVYAVFNTKVLKLFRHKLFPV